jgi:hypothetical protein
LDSRVIRVVDCVKGTCLSNFPDLIIGFEHLQSPLTDQA